MRHTSINQNTVLVMGGGVKMRLDHGGAYGEMVSCHLGQWLRWQKITKMKLNVVFRGDWQQTTHNNQLKTHGSNGGGAGKVAQPDGMIRLIASDVNFLFDVQDIKFMSAILGCNRKYVFPIYVSTIIYVFTFLGMLLYCKLMFRPTFLGGGDDLWCRLYIILDYI